MTNQDHDTPTEAGEPVSADAAGPVASEAGPANGAADPGIDATGSSVGQAGTGSGEAGVRRGEAGVRRGEAGVRGGDAGTTYAASYPAAAEPAAPGAAPEPGSAHPPPGHAESSDHLVPPQHGYGARYGDGGQPTHGSRDPGRHRPSYEAPDYGYGRSYEDPGQSYPERYADPSSPYPGPGSPYPGPGSPYAGPGSAYGNAGTAYSPPGSLYGDQGTAYTHDSAYSDHGTAYAPGSAYGDRGRANAPGPAYGDQGPTYRGPGQSSDGAGSSYANPEHDGGWDYADPGHYSSAPPYGAAAYPQSPQQAEPPRGAATGYPDVHGGHREAAGHGGSGDYADAPAGQLYGPAGALTPLPPRWTDQPPRETAESLTPESLLPTKKPAPAPGWRRAVYRMTAGLIRPGESQAELRRQELIYRARTPVAGGHHRVAVMSLKGGVGKTTTAVGLGAMLASLRGDRVIAVDANPDRGTLSDKVRLETAATVRDLLNERTQIQRYADVRAFTSQAPSRLELLASDRDPAVSVAFSETDYYDVAHVLEHYYSVCITDCGTGLLHSAMAGVLQLADQIVLVSSPSVDGARSASATLDWLEAHDYGDLVRNAVVVLSIIRPRSKSTVDIDRLEQHFAARCRAVARIPYDPHLEEGAEVDLELMNPETADAYLTLAATVGDGFAWPRRLRAAAS